MEEYLINKYIKNDARTVESFEYWKAQRNKSPMPIRNTKRVTDMHHVAFLDTTNYSKSPSNYDIVQSYLVNHLKRYSKKPAVPPRKTAIQKKIIHANKEYLNVDNEERKNCQFENKTKDNIKYNTNTRKVRHHSHWETQDLYKPDIVNHIKNNDRKDTLEYSEEPELCQSLPKVLGFDIEGPTRNKSARNVLEKFSKLNRSSRENCRETLRSKSEENFTTDEYFVNKNKTAKHKTKSRFHKNQQNCRETLRSKSEETFAIKEIYINKNKKVKQKSSKNINKYRLRSFDPKYQNKRTPDGESIEADLLNNDNRKYCNELLIPKYTSNMCTQTSTSRSQCMVIKNLQNIDTQTTPKPSSTNILINVYNLANPSEVLETPLESTDLNVNSKNKNNDDNKEFCCKNIDDNKEFCCKNIDDNKEFCCKNNDNQEQKNDENSLKVTKSSVKLCIQKFEDNLKEKQEKIKQKITENDGKPANKIKSQCSVQEKIQALTKKSSSVDF